MTLIELLQCLSGPFHSGGNGPDTFSRLTVKVKDSKNNQLYFFRTTDKTFWERLHIPEDRTIAAWPTKAIYVAITKEQFDK